MSELALKILYVEWVDAAAGNGWEKVERLDDIHKCISIGFLVKETKESIVLAAAVSEDEANATIAIPKAWIKRKKRVKL